MISAEIRELIDKSKADREEWKQLTRELIAEIRLLRLALQELPVFHFDRQGNLMVRETDLARD